jgi:hypothetical protein
LKAAIEAHKIPAARLSETQIAKLQERAANDQIVWYGAGQQSDGKTYLQSERAVLNDCRRRGFEPPIKLCHLPVGNCEMKPS